MFNQKIDIQKDKPVNNRSRQNMIYFWNVWFQKIIKNQKGDRLGKQDIERLYQKKKKGKIIVRNDDSTKKHFAKQRTQNKSSCMSVSISFSHSHIFLFFCLFHWRLNSSENRQLHFSIFRFSFLKFNIF